MVLVSRSENTIEDEVVLIQSTQGNGTVSSFLMPPFVLMMLSAIKTDGNNINF